jgi:HEAT repeat protein
MWIENRRWIASLGVLLALSGCAGDPAGKLTAQLSNTDPAIRRAAARALDENPSTNDRVITALAKGAADSDAEVRYFSISAIGKCGPAAISKLPDLKAALQDSEQRVRVRAAFAVHTIDPGDRSFETVLAAAMREGDGKTLLEVGAMGSQAAWAVPTLVELLSHRSPQVRVLAANSLGRIGPLAAGATSALQVTARDANPAVKYAAQTALERIESKSAPAGNEPKSQ